MDKYTVLKEIFEIENVSAKLALYSKSITLSSLLNAISKDSYSLKEELKPVSSTTISRTLKVLWPSRSAKNTKLCTWLLLQYGLRYCPNCKQVKELDDFYKNAVKTTNGGVNTHCKSCVVDTRRVYQRSYQADRRALQQQRLPSWANLERIKEFYTKCPEGHHVDHIIPLKGELVSGLHVEYNLQYLLAIDNVKKRNKFDII